MLIRFKFYNGVISIHNTENVIRMGVYDERIRIVEGSDDERNAKFSSQERAIEALDKIYVAYANGLKAITIEVD